MNCEKSSSKRGRRNRYTWSFVLVAAGSGSRMGGGKDRALPKQFWILGGLPLWLWSARVAESLCLGGDIDELVVVFPQSFMDCDDFKACARGGKNFGLKCNVKFTAGGASRADSVKRGLAAASSDFVLVHDAARPFLTDRICLDLIEAADFEKGAVPLLASVDSLKSIQGTSISAMDRASVYRTQTPQAFARERLAEAMESYAGEATDEASAWLFSSLELGRVGGDEANFKITTDYDWRLANSLICGMRESRTGFGYDVHELVPERPLVLGGVPLSSPMGLLGHSDADVICHAISDALLGAAGLGDIGTLFPASDEKYKGADSSLLLEQVLELIHEDGWRIAWLDATLIAQIPRLGDKIAEILDNLKMLFTRNGQQAKLSLKVKSGEHVGSVGRAECMICNAVATIERFDSNIRY